MKTIKLEWKSFSMNGRLIETNLKALCDKITGVSEDYTYQVHCSDDLTDDESTLIQAHWDAIANDSTEATSFKSRDIQKSDSATAKAVALVTATSKLAALGLSDDEIKAIVGG